MVGSGVVDKLGGLIVTNLTPGPGYRFEAAPVERPQRRPLRSRCCRRSSTPSPQFYADQHLHVGLNYVEMRDGITWRRRFASLRERLSQTVLFRP